MKYRRRDAGVTTVEFAFVVFIIILITIEGIDLGLWVFQRSEASQAAREASRIAMISPPVLDQALTTGSVYEAAVGEVESNLQDFKVWVTCAASADAPDSIKDASQCVTGDFVTVTVSWTRQSLAFLGPTTVSGSSTRTVVGIP